MRLSCSTLCCSGSDYPDLTLALDKIRALGFSAIDLVTFDGWQNVDPSSLVGDRDRRRTVQRAVATSGLRVSSLNVGFSAQINDPDKVRFEIIEKELAALLDLAKDIECPLLTVQPGRLFEGQTSEKALSMICDRLGSLVEQTRAAGVVLSVEAHQGSLLEDPQVALEFLGALSPDVGLTYDPSHFVMQGFDLTETRPLLEITTHVHVRNARANKMQETMTDGVIDFIQLLTALKETGYEDDVAIEYFNGFDADFSSTLELAELLRRHGVTDN